MIVILGASLAIVAGTAFAAVRDQPPTPAAPAAPATTVTTEAPPSTAPESASTPRPTQPTTTPWSAEANDGADGSEITGSAGRPDTSAPDLVSTTRWSGPPGSPVPATATCPPTGHAAVVDREWQRMWLCDAGTITAVLPASTAESQPDPGSYAVFARDIVSWSRVGGRTSVLDRFVAFTRGERTGARIAFHAVPHLGDGTLVQPIESIGDLERRGESAGCIRVRPDDAVLIWDWLQLGAPVLVVS